MKISLKKWLKQDFIKKIIKNSGILLTGSFGGSLIGLVSFAIIIRTLGANRHGEFVIMQTYMETFNSLLNFQCWQALITFGSKAIIDNDNLKFKSIIKTGLYFDVISAILGTIAALLSISIFSYFFNWTKEQENMTLIFSLLILTNITGTPIGILRLLKEFKLLSSHRIVNSLIKLLLVLIGSYMKLSSNNFIILLIIIILIEQLTMIFFAIYVLKKNNLLDFLKVKIFDWKDFVKFALWTNIESTINIPKKKLDKFFISKYLSNEAVSTFKLFTQFNQILTKITNSIYYAIFPELSSKIANGKRKSAIKDGVKVGLILLAAGAPFFIIFVISSKFLIGPVFGEEYIKSWNLLVFYIAYNYVSVLFTALDPLIISLGFVKNKVSINLISNIVFIAIIIYLQGNYGLFGFLIADVVQKIIVYIMKINIIHKKELKS
ncbi:MAG: oligosaccharide flippase family protein [Spirochaetales bacterium]|nr:oligosaccharide flippase family protein [Spirochaetales bacterium]